ncbi:MAG TPA: hypothetical protein VMR08_03375 [Patescibacteria group bacterium]|jgi:hypothetical protein|nr:hypothetical protein [Patescibacteria group bacterium]
MARTIGGKTKNLMKRPPTSELTSEERMQLIANLIVDRIIDGDLREQALPKELKRVLECKTT